MDNLENRSESGVKVLPILVAEFIVQLLDWFLHGARVGDEEFD